MHVINIKYNFIKNKISYIEKIKTLSTNSPKNNSVKDRKKVVSNKTRTKSQWSKSNNKNTKHFRLKNTKNQQNEKQSYNKKNTLLAFNTITKKRNKIKIFFNNTKNKKTLRSNSFVKNSLLNTKRQKSILLNLKKKKIKFLNNIKFKHKTNTTNALKKTKFNKLKTNNKKKFLRPFLKMQKK
jgi:hypothetical protein